MAVQIVHELEPVQVGEEDRSQLARSPGPTDRVVQPFDEEDPIGEAGERVVQRQVQGSVGRISQVHPCLRVQEIGGRDVGQGLGRVHGVAVQHPRGTSIQIEGSQLCGPVAEREREHRPQPRLDRTGCEPREAVVVVEVRHRDGTARFVRDQARSFHELRLELLEPQRGFVRGRHETRGPIGRDDRHAGAGDREDIDDALHEVIEDGLDGEIRDQRACELTQHVRKLLVARHDRRPFTGGFVAAGLGGTMIELLMLARCSIDKQVLPYAG